MPQRARHDERSHAPSRAAAVGADEQGRGRREQHEQPTAVRPEAAAPTATSERSATARRGARGAPGRASPERGGTSRAGWRRRRTARPRTGRRGQGKDSGSSPRTKRYASRTDAHASPSGSTAAASATIATTHQPASQRFAARPSSTTRGARPGASTAAMYARPPSSRVSGGGCGRSARSGAPGAAGSRPGPARHHLEPAVRDVGERDEAVDPRRARRENAARARA